MTPDAPRHSTLGALRESYLGARHWQGVRVDNPFVSANMSPAYSQDSEIVCCGFGTTNEGPIFVRRTPDDENGKEATSLAVNGGAAWCPDNNKFYHGVTQLNQPTGDGMAVIIDPEKEQFELIAGFATGFAFTGGRAFYHPDAGDIWLAFSGGGTAFYRIDVSDNSLTTVAGSSPVDFCYCASNGAIYFKSALNVVFKVTTGGAVSTIFTEADFETAFGGPVSGYSIGAIEYVDSIDRVLFHVQATSVPYDFFWQINPGTDTASVYHSGGGGRMYYTSDFDRIILQDLNGKLRSWLPDFSVGVDLGWNGTSTDILTAFKGTYCDNVMKIALPVLTGPAGGRFRTINFYGSGEL
jgi:hypothetical protein